VEGTETWAVGEQITICYEPGNPKNIMLKPDDTKWLGIVLIVVGALLVLALGILVYKVFTNKQTAATFGAFEAVNSLMDGGRNRYDYRGGGAGGGGLLSLLM
jgi:hypothetical protein